MLASIQTIQSVESIPGADRIEKVKVLGWNCVVKKGSFNPGDPCIYIEIDTMIPKSFLTDKEEDKNTLERLRTVQFRGQISQGLVLPLSVFKNIYGYELTEYDLGDDLTKDLGIKKYEEVIPVEMEGLMKNGFPSFISKTDENRIQSYPEMLKSLIGKPYYITLKIDGVSGTYFKNPTFGMCSRSIELLPNPTIQPDSKVSMYWEVAKKYQLEKLLPEGIAIQAEIAGPGIKGNKLGLSNRELFVFNVFDIQDHERFPFEDMRVFLLKKEIPMVPIVEYGYEFKYSFEELMDLSDQLNYQNGGKAEGIVIRSTDQSISFKVVSNKFLLKYGE